MKLLLTKWQKHNEIYKACQVTKSAVEKKITEMTLIMNIRIDMTLLSE